MKTLIKNATIINDGLKFTGNVLIDGEKIKKVYPSVLPSDFDLAELNIIDAKGLNAKPAMSPKVVDENGQEVYGSAYVSREFAVQQGMKSGRKAPGKR